MGTHSELQALYTFAVTIFPARGRVVSGLVAAPPSGNWSRLRGMQCIWGRRFPVRFTVDFFRPRLAHRARDRAGVKMTEINCS